MNDKHPAPQVRSDRRPPPGPRRPRLTVTVLPGTFLTVEISMNEAAGWLKLASTSTSEKLAHQEGGVIPTRVSRAQHTPHECAGDPRPLRAPRKRHSFPDRRPRHQYTRLPGRPRPREITRAGRTPQGCTPDSAALVKPERGPRPGTGIPSSGYPHRSLAPIPVRYVSADTATRRSTARQGDTPRDKGKRPASARIRS
jgi:hypothetical protein